MNKTIAILLGAFGVLIAGTHAQAAVTPQSAPQVVAASSYVGPLRPVPTAFEAAPATIEYVQYYPYYYPRRPPPPYYWRHHHHFHHLYHRRFFRHHDFHHHHGYGRRW